VRGETVREAFDNAYEQNNKSFRILAAILLTCYPFLLPLLPGY